MKRILSLDGGGIHGVFTLEVLRRIELLLAERYGSRPNFVLADHFDLIAGTSTGAIIASMLAWGARVEDIARFYHEQAGAIFHLSPWQTRWLYHRFTSESLTEFLQKYFTERDGQPALLGSSRLRTLLLVVLRNATTGSPWPVTNNPAALYNCRPPGETNLEIPLWQIVRASTAAPTYFPAQRIAIWSMSEQRKKEFDFIDGGVSPYNNPAYLAYLTATLPEYRINFRRGVDHLSLVSVGVGRPVFRYTDGEVQDMTVIGHATAVIRAVMDAAAVQQDFLCRTTGLCLHGEDLDRELTALMPAGEPDLHEAKNERAFSYVRYNYTYLPEEMHAVLARAGGKWDLANLNLIPDAAAAGRRYAETAVRKAHLV